ncbi:unnamed protein product [Chironomus riparius]|uniref:Zinc finger protein-like 1 homolog n=1 Tax=Chironomus riparius TaxID=315576 RepID=A0A9N9S0S4_9DIPT|nr:unnamed protein product [Chironomus riparius]
MGLCKCPKRVVSNLFCFSHRVTVCESCLVLNHRKCVIQSYLQWLKDSDYDSSCSLCGTDLESDDCIRLICYDLFHKKCLEERQSALPSTTAASGHQCPKCDACIFPSSNLVSPVADALRIWLSQVNFGRNEMNLPMFSEEKEFKSASRDDLIRSNGTSSNNLSSSVMNSKVNIEQTQYHRTNVPEKVFRPESPHSVLNIESRPLLRSGIDGRNSDRDDNKYKRKTPQEIFSRWSRQFYAPSARPPWRKKWFLGLIAFLLFILIIYVMYHFGRSESDELDNFHYEE